MKIIKSIKKYITEENKNILLGLLIILTLFWLILYFIPSLFISLFHTILGNIILCLSVIMVSITNYKYGIILAIILIVLSRFSYLSEKEGFQWNEDQTEHFLRLQKTLNPHRIFDVEEIQKHASPKEVDYLLKNNMWPWSKDVTDLYESYLLKNVYIQNEQKDSINHARRIYNENAILQILSEQSKEGQFLLNGVEVNSNKNMMPNGVGLFGYNSGLVTNMYNPVYKCGENKKTGIPEMKRFQYIGDDKMLGSHTTKIEDVDVSSLEKIIPGFKFVNSQCDPCSALNYDSEEQYKCPFEIKIKKNKGPISAIWDYLWSLKNPNKNPNKNMEINANKFEFPKFSS
jgi:hypothetical protein